MGFEDGPEINGLAGEERFPRRDRVQQETERHLPDGLSQRQAFGHHDQVVPEIEEDLPFVALGKRSASDMIHDRFGTAIHLITGQLYPPAEIDFFLVREKKAFQAAQPMIQRSPDKKCSPAGPENRFRSVILPRILFTHIEHPAPGKGIAEIVEPSARRTRIFERSAIGIHPYLGLTGANQGITFHQPDDGLHPPGPHLDVRVQKDIIVGLDLAEGGIVSSRETIIAIEQNDADSWEGCLKERDGVVGRAIVGDDHLRSIAGIGHYHGKKLPEISASVEIEYDDGCRGGHDPIINRPMAGQGPKISVPLVFSTITGNFYTFGYDSVIA